MAGLSKPQSLILNSLTFSPYAGELLVVSSTLDDYMLHIAVCIVCNRVTDHNAENTYGRKAENENKISGMFYRCNRKFIWKGCGQIPATFGKNYNNQFVSYYFALEIYKMKRWQRVEIFYA